MKLSATLLVLSETAVGDCLIQVHECIAASIRKSFISLRVHGRMNKLSPDGEWKNSRDCTPLHRFSTTVRSAIR